MFIQTAGISWYRCCFYLIANNKEKKLGVSLDNSKPSVKVGRKAMGPIHVGQPVAEQHTSNRGFY